MRRFCLALGWFAGLTAPLWAGETAAPERLTTVIRPDPRSGRLVRSVIVTPKPVVAPRIAAHQVPETEVPPRAVAPAAAAHPPAQPATGLDEAVERIAAQHSLPPQLIHSVIKVESNYNPRAISPKGAQGLMQLMPATARRFGVADSFNPVENIQGGARYLKYLLQLYNGDYPLALAAYNAGEAAVAKYGDVPPFAETKNYLTQVARQLKQAQKTGPANSGAVEPATAGTSQPDAKPEAPKHIQEIVAPDGTIRYVSR